MLPAPWLFPWLFGEAWAVSGRYVQILSLTFFSQFLVQTVTAETLAITGQQHWQLVGESLRVVSVVVVFLLARQWSRDALWTVTTYALVSLVLYAFQLAVTWWSAGRTSIYVRE
jgi:O-antigen/teichoic acid export membrane protein